MKHFLATALALMVPCFAFAATETASTQEPTENETLLSDNVSPKVKFLIANDAAAAAQPADVLVIQPKGRILMDAAAYAGNNDEFAAGVAFPDIRAGVKARYGKWKAGVDVGYAFDKLALKDVFIEYDFSPEFLLRGGSFIHQFGLQSATSSSMKTSMEEPTSSEAFTFPRLIGLMGIYDKGQFFGALSLNVQSDAIKKHANELGKTGYGGITRLVYRPFTSTGQVLQAGISFALQSATHQKVDGKTTDVVEIKANFPTRVNSVSMLNATMTDARHSFRFTPELLLNAGRVALEAQYFYMNVSRHSAEAFKGWGAYGMLRGLAIGDSYRYSHADAALATPAPRSLEFVLLYNYTSLSCKDAGIMGGRSNDVSLTANWYINKFMIWRLRAGYTHRFDRAGTPDTDLGTFQTRIQIIF